MVFLANSMRGAVSSKAPFGGFRVVLGTELAGTVGLSENTTG